MSRRHITFADDSQLRPTIQTIATQAGVSISTVSRALRNNPLISQETCRRIREVAERLGYVPNPYISTLMSHLRAGRAIPYQATLALVDTFPTIDSWKQYIVHRKFFIGAEQRARQLGYTLERIWALEKGMTRERLTHTLVSRGIRGVIIPPLKDYSLQGADLPVDFDQFACVTLGCKMMGPTFHFATNDQYFTGMLAHEKLLEKGYQNVGLVIPDHVECIVEQRFSSGFRNAFERRGRARARHSVFRYRHSEGGQGFPEWIKTFKPDAICTIFSEVSDWIRAMKLRVPKDIGLASLDWNEELPEWAGVNQESERVGAAAIDLLIQMLQRNELGVPKHPMGITIEGNWVDGKTLRKKR
jgi:LacI family transcriptional regulator